MNRYDEDIMNRFDEYADGYDEEMDMIDIVVYHSKFNVKLFIYPLIYLSFYFSTLFIPPY